MIPPKEPLEPSICHIIGVAGGSGSGKTTFAHALQKYLGDDRCSILSQDHYYVDQSSQFTADGETVNFDHPSSLDLGLMVKHILSLRMGETIQVPIYDFKTHKRQNEFSSFISKPFVIVDGTLILHHRELRLHLDRCVFVQTSEELRYHRRLKRDVKERGRTPDGVQKQFFTQVKPMHDLYVEPSKEFADFIIEEDLSLDENIDLFVKTIQQNLIRSRHE